jgi:hypothetical protein
MHIFAQQVNLQCTIRHEYLTSGFINVIITNNRISQENAKAFEAQPRGSCI